MRRLIIIITAVLLLTPVPVNAAGRGWYGSTRTEFQNAIKQKKLKLKKVKVGKTILLYDSKLPAKRVKLVKKWIRQLPAKVQKSARKIYFLRKKYYLMTGKGLKDTSGYSMFPEREIWFYNVSDSDELMDTIFHEFGHCWDWNGKKFKLSNSNEWERIWVSWLGASEDPTEWFAYCFAELWTTLQDPDFSYIYKHLAGG